MKVKRYKNYITWKDKKGKFNTECNRASLENDVALTIPTFSLTKVAIEKVNGGGCYNMPNLRIRKLTPCECLKLMGFTREDYEAMRQIGMSDSQIYHCAGDSLITTIAAGLIGSMCLDEKELRQKQENYVEVVRTDEKKNN